MGGERDAVAPQAGDRADGLAREDQLLDGDERRG